MPVRPESQLINCDTLMLDMDGTLLDLAFDNYFWLQLVPLEYARRRRMPQSQARDQLYAKMRALQGTLDWYCLDYWSEILGLDIAGMHRDANDRIGYLPGAEEFLEHVAASGVRMLLVTNSHRTTLDIKNEVTNVTRFFDEIYTSHDVGHAKEDQPFWKSVKSQENFDPERTMLIDDNLQVLESARKFGVKHLVAVAQPDTTAPVRDVVGFPAVDRVSNLIAG